MFRLGSHLVVPVLVALSTPALSLAADRPAPATIVVRLPADAVLTIDGAPTRQTGGERTFFSPALTPGKNYVYQMTATWTEKGAPRKETRDVPVSAGKRTTIDFTAAKKSAATPRSRAFEFTYEATVTGLKPGEEARVWLPVAQTTGDQEVKVLKTELPAKGAVRTEPRYGNRVLFVEAKADADGKVPLKVTYRVTRREVKGEADEGMKEGLALRKRFLEADALVPVDGKPLELIKGKELPDDPMAKARTLYDVVNNHMRYSKEGAGWGRGDSAWACDSKYGNCSDFHSLFISLARSQKIPAKFEIGFPLPEKRGAGDIPGYHCWAFFQPKGKGWVPVDISEANKDPKRKDYFFGNLTEDRVTFSTGRDVDLVPKQAGKPLNFFIYPYVEVDGKEYPQEKVVRKFSFKDVK